MLLFSLMLPTFLKHFRSVIKTLVEDAWDVSRLLSPLWSTCLRSIFGHQIRSETETKDCEIWPFASVKIWDNKRECENRQKMFSISPTFAKVFFCHPFFPQHSLGYTSFSLTEASCVYVIGFMAALVCRNTGRKREREEDSLLAFGWRSRSVCVSQEPSAKG